MSRIFLSLLATYLVANASSNASEFKLKYTEICQDKQVHLDKRVHLDRAEFVLLAKFNSEPSSASDEIDSICPPVVRKSIIALAKLISEQEHVCSQKQAILMRNFYHEFILDPKQKAPRAVQAFYALYGSRLSQMCRARMVDELQSLHNNMHILTVEDLKFHNHLANDTSLMSFIINEPMDGKYKDLILPKIMLQTMDVHEQELVPITIKSSEKIKSIQAACLHRFKPVYSQLIRPLVTLGALGFNYYDLKPEPRDNKLNKLVYRWYRISFLCEALNSFMLVDNEPHTEGAGYFHVNIQPKEAADENSRITYHDDLANLYPNILKLNYSPREQTSMPKVIEVDNVKLLSETRKRLANISKPKKFVALDSLTKNLRDKINRGIAKYMFKHFRVSSANELFKFIDQSDYQVTLGKLLAIGDTGKCILFWAVFIAILGLIAFLIYAAITSDQDGSAGYYVYYIFSSHRRKG